MAEACWKCGTTEAETYRYCSARKMFVCKTCESNCSNYSKQMLPNGTNCKLKYMSPINKLFKYLSNTDEVKKAKIKYEKLPKNVLTNRFNDIYKSFCLSDDAAQRSLLRVELAAIQELLEAGNGRFFI